DTLRTLAAIRELTGAKEIAVVARGEMTAVALYATLLDGHISTLFIDSPPATQNAPSRPDRRGPAIEMLACLRITDLPQVAGLLFPTELVVAGKVPETYQWAASLYSTLGKKELYHAVQELSVWRTAI